MCNFMQNPEDTLCKIQRSFLIFLLSKN
uniref:Uncharacterized protein n=1 Tax=Ciona intestinalis TaxID=7719 RepID=H2XKC3_CIOIN